jgi:hypothetical protein
MAGEGRPGSVLIGLARRRGRNRVTDGPFAETTEEIGGFIVVDVPDPRDRGTDGRCEARPSNIRDTRSKS